MKQRNEKQEEAYKLIDGILSIDMDVRETKPFTQWNRTKTERYQICLINGEKWVQVRAANWMKVLQENGWMDVKDFLHVRTKLLVGNGSRILTIVRLNAMFANRKRILEYADDAIDTAEKLEALIESADTTNVETSYSFNKADIAESERNYKRRVQLLNESKKEKQEEENRQKLLEAINQPKEPTLDELVEKIREIGWGVTLTKTEQSEQLDLEQRKYEIAKEVMPQCIATASSLSEKGIPLVRPTLGETAAKMAVDYAEALIKELKR